MKTCDLVIDGQAVGGAVRFPVVDKFSGAVIAEVVEASEEQVGEAVRAARRAFETRRLAPYERFTILARAAELLEARRSLFVDTIVAETGFTISDASGEVSRAVETMLLSGEEAKRIHGEMIPLEGAPGVSNRIGFTVRVPVGVVCAITPFNAPLNTVVHKVAPALAAGNTVVLKPATYTPLTASLVCDVLAEAGMPAGFVNLVHGGGSTVGRWLLQHGGIAFYTFTGSTAVGQLIQRTVGLRRTQLELGSISATLVCEDADLNWAVPRCVNAGFRKAGQVCTSLQRLYVDRRVVEPFLERLVTATRALQVGNPREPGCTVGPMIAASEAQRAEAWINEAIGQGAELVTGGTRDGAILAPTILLNVSSVMRVVCEEIFAPVISVVPFDSLARAVAEVNDTPYGLAVGVFTSSLERAFQLSRDLEFGAVHVNETSSSRIDLMPYGGVKDSGFGREGPKYAIREMTNERLITITLPPR